MGEVTAEVYHNVDALPADVWGLMAGALFQSSKNWWRCLTDAALAPGMRPWFVLCRDAGRQPVMLVPLQTSRRGVSGLTVPFTCLYQPVTQPGLPDRLLILAGTALGNAIRQFAVLRLDALDGEWPGLPPLLAGLRGAGYHAARFTHFANWHEPVAGRGWTDYVSARPGALRETVQRKLRRCDKDPGCHVALACTPEEAEAAMPLFEQIYSLSWKQPEPYPAFGPRMVQAAAQAGLLRLCVLSQGGRPVAAQYWVVERGTATILKLAHDEAARHLSPGTVLTAWMIRHLLEKEHVVALDFGRGDDPYKRSWATQRRERIGVLLANPRRPAGLAALGRHLLGRAARRVTARG